MTQPQQLEDCPEAALIFALLFKRLGGWLCVGSNGVRYAGRPEPALFRLNGDGLPQLARAEPHEQFHSADEWRGAIKLVDYVLSRISDADKELVYGSMASIAVDDRKPFDFRQQLDG